MLVDCNNEKILNNSNLRSLFLSASLNDINEDCKILTGNFYLDSFHYFPITSNYETFHNLFKIEDNNSIKHFYTEDFFKNLTVKENSFKVFENSIVLGSSPADTYFTNLIHFLPRIFFLNEKKINLVIHRNLSNKFRKLIKLICVMREIDIKFSYIDDDFYKFNNSFVPQFFNIEKSIKILRYFFEKILVNIQIPDFNKKIYIRREDSNYRKILNEADLIEKMKKKGFEIINPNHYEILEQMKIFSNADMIVSPHGSNLSNIVFCKKGAQLIEIGPRFENSYEENISTRYKKLSNIANVEYFKIKADSVDVDSHSNIAKKYIDKKILDESNYYKNIILKVSEIDKLINNL